MSAAQMVLTELPEFPHVPELPSRGPWFDMVGRGCAALLDLSVTHAAGRWSFVRSGRSIGTDLRKARSGLMEDTERFAEMVNRRQELEAHEGQDSLTAVKVQICGPITLAASVELPNGQVSLSDVHARADIAASLAEGLRHYVAEVGSLFSDAPQLVVQVDEPAITAALQGTLPTVSGLGRHPALAADEVEAHLVQLVAPVAAATHEVVMHCCAKDPPVRILGASGARALSLDLTMLPPSSESADQLCEWLQEGNHLFAGVSVSDPGASVAGMSQLMGEEWLADQGSKQLTLTPPCGLANVTFDQAQEQYQGLRRMQRDLGSGELS